MERTKMSYEWATNTNIINKLKEKATFQNTYRFLDVDFVVKSNSRKILELYGDSYDRFRTYDVDTTDKIYYIIVDSAPSNEPLIIIGDHTLIVIKLTYSKMLDIFKDTYLLDLWMKSGYLKVVDAKELSSVYCMISDGDISIGPQEVVVDKMDVIGETDVLIYYADFLIYSSVFSAIHGFHLIHAGAVSHGDHGIVLAGNSKCGKTTLTLGLVKKGFKFLSDDVTSIELATHKIVSFPKSLGIREDFSNFFTELSLENKEYRINVNGEKKWDMDIEDIFVDSISEASTMRYILFLKDFQNSPK